MLLCSQLQSQTRAVLLIATASGAANPKHLQQHSWDIFDCHVDTVHNFLRGNVHCVYVTIVILVYLSPRQCWTVHVDANIHILHEAKKMLMAFYY